MLFQVPRGENVFGTAFNIIATAFKVRFGSRFNGEKRESFLDYAKIAYSEQQVEDLKAVRLLPVSWLNRALKLNGIIGIASTDDVLTLANVLDTF